MPPERCDIPVLMAMCLNEHCRGDEEGGVHFFSDLYWWDGELESDSQKSIPPGMGPGFYCEECFSYSHADPGVNLEHFLHTLAPEGKTRECPCNECCESRQAYWDSIPKDRFSIYGSHC